MKKVTIYSTPTCVYCNMAKSYFQEKNVPYEEFNVGQDFERQKEMIELTGQRGVPVIVIDGEAIVGFNKPRVQELLGL